MGEDKAGFAARTRAAMKDKGWPVRPSELTVRFNLRYEGRSVTFQTVSGWLRGASLPKAEKLETLAQVLGVTPAWLLFGHPQASGVAEVPATYDVKASSDLEAAFVTARAFPPEEKRYLVATIELVQRLLKR